jgi:hypothetical protein
VKRLPTKSDLVLPTAQKYGILSLDINKPHTMASQPYIELSSPAIPVGSGGLERSLVRKPLPEQVGGGFCVSKLHTLPGSGHERACTNSLAKAAVLR